MERVLSLALGGWLFIASARADLQLTPKLVDYELDGAKLQQLVFRDGEKQITYTPPTGWQYLSSNNNLFVLHPRGARGEATIARISLARPESFDDETIKRLSDEVLVSVPGDAKNVGIVSQQKNVVMIERKETLLIIIKYEFYGEPQERSVLFVNRKDEQLRFQLTCPESNFAQLQKVFLASHFSWQNL
jgi:hypothetical protein